MIQPINGRILVQVSDDQYKYVKLSSEKQHLLASSTGVVISVSPDLEQIIRGALKIKEGEWLSNFIRPTDLVGKKIRWEKYAEQNSLFEIEDPKHLDNKIKVALIEYKDITSYDN